MTQTMNNIDKQISEEAYQMPKPVITEKHRLVLDGKHCPYCDVPTEHVSADVIYAKSGYGMIYLCPKCRAYVGCHKEEPTKSKGRVANASLRKAKVEAHAYFDLIWRGGYFRRKTAYRWLATKLKLHPDYCHIGMFNEKTCYDVAFYSKQFLNDMRRLDMDFGQTPKTPYYEL